MTTHAHVSLSPLRLNRYFLKSLNFKVYDEFDHGAIPKGMKISVPPMGVGAFSDHNPNNPRQWRIELSLNLSEPEEDKFPYKVDATLVGYFTVDKRYPEAEIERLVKTAGAALLYSTARDTVAAVTGRSSFAPLILQSAMFRLEEDPPSRKHLAAVPPKQLKGKPKPARKVAKKK